MSKKTITPVKLGLLSWCRTVNEVRTLIEEDLTSGKKVWFAYNRALLSSRVTN